MTIKSSEAMSVMEAKAKKLGLPMLEPLEFCVCLNKWRMTMLKTILTSAVMTTAFMVVYAGYIAHVSF